jgi:hypothetical protein
LLQRTAGAGGRRAIIHRDGIVRGRKVPTYTVLARVVIVSYDVLVQTYSVHVHLLTDSAAKLTHRWSRRLASAAKPNRQSWPELVKLIGAPVSPLTLTCLVRRWKAR